MFSIQTLTMIGCDGERYPYKFSQGINYIYGPNGTGKSEFYGFLDFMLGATPSSTAPLPKKEWYANTLDAAELTIDHGEDKYTFFRTIDGQCFSIKRNHHEIPCKSLQDYCEIIGSLLDVPSDALKVFKLYVGERLQYRSMTIFNFLGEKGAGTLDDFFEKSSELKYSLKLPRILDFLFNSHVQEIARLEDEAAILREQLKQTEEHEHASDFLVDLINEKLSLLSSPFIFSGHNIDGLRKAINECREGSSGRTRTENVEGLRFAAQSMANKVSALNRDVENTRSMTRLQENRAKLLKVLASVADGQQDYAQCVHAAMEMITEIEEGASYSRIELKQAALKKAKIELKRLNSQLDALELSSNPNDVEQRQIALGVLDDAVSRYENIDQSDSSQISTRIQELQKNINQLKAEDDQTKLVAISNLITEYYAACSRSTLLAAEDFTNQGYRIDFLKRGCALRPSKIEENSEQGRNRVSYIVGSFARHALIQLCGYTAFMEFLLNDTHLPVLPLLCIDHPSKPFDETNRKGIGSILNKFADRNKDAQVFIFDSAHPADLGITISPIDLSKTPGGGFNPFYRH